jgi:hypothetical protein
VVRQVSGGFEKIAVPLPHGAMTALTPKPIHDPTSMSRLAPPRAAKRLAVHDAVHALRITQDNVVANLFFFDVLSSLIADASPICFAFRRSRL